MECIGFGVCRLATISVMKGPEWTGPQTTQLLFGEHYLVMSKTRQGWLEIHAPVIDISGWIRHEQHHDISSDFTAGHLGHAHATAIDQGVAANDHCIDQGKGNSTVVVQGLGRSRQPHQHHA